MMETFDANPSVECNELVTKGNLEERKQENEALKNAEKSDGTDDTLPAECVEEYDALEEYDKNKPEMGSNFSKPNEEQVIFKKPSLALGPIRGKVIDGKNCSSSKVSVDKPVSSKIGTTGQNVDLAKNKHISNNLAPIPYTEPAWAGYPSRVYGFEIIKGGQIIENFDLSTRSYNCIGRSPNSDIVLLHPTISRYHAIIQFRDDDKGTSENPPGMYLYDMGSTHGTFLNKNRVKPKMYIRIHVGHVLKFGASTRHFVLKGPQEEEEEESLLSVSQIQSQRSNELIRRKLDEIKGKVPEEEQGISWGMDDDADEETDLSINPFALTNNEELYIDDPKKTLRGWFEREGHELVYNVEEKSSAQFRCYIEIPVESCRGGIHVAEAIVKGKKKEAVVQCALEACRVLDQYGLLRQATHESKKRKAKDWEAEDYYDSDDDTFLDRTGTVEKKRRARMEAHSDKQVLTYHDLLKKHEDIMLEVKEAEARWTVSNKRKQHITSTAQAAQDELDEYMNTLKECPDQRDKALLSQLKTRIQELKGEAEQIRRLINRVRPSDAPELESDGPSATEPVSRADVFKRMSEINRKTRALMKQRKATTGIPPTTKKFAKLTEMKPTPSDFIENECEYEIDTYDTLNSKSSGEVTSAECNLVKPPMNSNGKQEGNVVQGTGTRVGKCGDTCETAAEEVESDASDGNIVQGSSGCETGSDVIENMKAKIKLEEHNERLVSKELPKECGKKLKMKDACDSMQAIEQQENNDMAENHETDKAATRTEGKEEGLGTDEEDNEGVDREEAKKKKRNRKRNMQRNAKTQKEKHARWTESDGPPELFSDWTPPQGQSGDGRTSLNDKLGY